MKPTLLVATALIVTTIGISKEAWGQKVVGSLAGAAGGAAMSLGVAPSGALPPTSGIAPGGVPGVNTPAAGWTQDDITLNASPAAVSIDIKVFKFKF